MVELYLQPRDDFTFGGPRCLSFEDGDAVFLSARLDGVTSRKSPL
jgi:hypothetical protein